MAVKILDKEYELRLTMWAKLELQKKYGSFKPQDIFEVDDDEELYKRIIGIARIMVQAANLRAKMNVEMISEEDLPPEDVWMFLEEKEMGDIIQGIVEAYKASNNITVEVQPDPKATATQSE